MKRTVVAIYANPKGQILLVLEVVAMKFHQSIEHFPLKISQ
jgi:hypothetical protein